MDSRPAGNRPAPHEPSAEQVARLLDVLAGGDVRATIKGLERALAYLRLVLAARDELLPRATPNTVKAALDRRRARMGSA
jgi:hypothetical protein